MIRVARTCTIHDSRGRAFRVPEPGPAHPPGDRDERRLALDEHRRLRLALGILRAPVRMAGATLIVCALGISMIVTSFQSHIADRAELSIAGGILLVLGAGTPVVLLRGRRRYRAGLAQLPPMCAACGCDMAGVYPERDGCAVCPRCMAAWRFAPPERDDAPPES